MFSILAREPEIKDVAGRAAAESDQRHHPLRECALRLRAGAAHSERRQLRRAGRQDGGGGRPVRRRQVDDLAAAVPLLRSGRRPHPDRRPGHRQGHAKLAAPGDRHGAAGHRAVQRHHPLQHPLRPLGSEQCRGGGGGAARADRRFDPARAERLRDRGRRARPEAIGRREAARGDRPHHPEGAADPGARRGDLGARQPHRKGNPGRAGAGIQGPHHAGDRAPALHHRRRRRDHRARSGRDRRARHAFRAARCQRALCQHVEPPARGGGGAREARPRGRGRGRAQPQSAAGRGCHFGRAAAPIEAPADAAE